MGYSLRFFYETDPAFEYETDLAFKYESELVLKDDESDLSFNMRVSLF